MNKKLVKKIGLIVLAVVMPLMTSFVIYASIYYHSNTNISDITNVTVEARSEAIYLTPETEYSQMIVFYPGGKVAPEAYLPLMAEISSRGVFVVICEMPYNLAVLAPSAAKPIIEGYSNLDAFIMGHSLGGAMAGSYASKFPDSLEGLILLGAYSTKTVSIPSLSIYGSMDNILNMDKYDENLSNLLYVEEYVIPGGNHSQFGDYGLQRKDGVASIDMATQISLTADKIMEFLDAN